MATTETWASQFCFALVLYSFICPFCPLLLENTQTKPLIIALKLISETTLYAQLPCLACCSGTAGCVPLEQTSFLSLSVLRPCFPGCSFSLSLRGFPSFPPPAFCQGPMGFCHCTPSLLPFTSRQLEVQLLSPYHAQVYSCSCGRVSGMPYSSV